MTENQTSSRWPADGQGFTHTPFNDAANEIRLLGFNEAKANQESLHVDITSWSIQEAPPYVAASYMWGSSGDTSWITINGLDYMIRRNCYDALRQIRKQAPHMYVWIDSICINQANLDEKALQVAKMRDIYSKAKTVYSCIGDHADGSEGIMSMARDVGRYVGRLRHSYDPENVWSLVWYFYLDPARKPFGGGPGLLRFHTALAYFCNRPYWHRMWIIQEVHLAQQCLVLCGIDFTSFDHIMALVNSWWHGLVNDLVPQEATLHNVPGVQGSYLVGLTDPINNRQRPNAKLSNRLPLDEALQNYSSWKCSDRRDRVYALLGIASWPFSCTPIKPDYSMSRL